MTLRFEKQFGALYSILGRSAEDTFPVALSCRPTPCYGNSLRGSGGVLSCDSKKPVQIERDRGRVAARRRARESFATKPTGSALGQGQPHGLGVPSFRPCPNRKSSRPWRRSSPGWIGASICRYRQSVYLWRLRGPARRCRGGRAIRITRPRQIDAPNSARRNRLHPNCGERRAHCHSGLRA